MPHKKTKEKIPEGQKSQFERAASVFRTALRDAMMSVRPFSDDYKALAALGDSLHRTQNLLNGRPAEYVEHHRPALSGGK